MDDEMMEPTQFKITEGCNKEILNRIRGLVTQFFNIFLCFVMMVLSIKMDMKVTPILFAISVWCGSQDSLWATARADSSRKDQFEFWFYHLVRMWAYSLGFLAFAVEYILD